jgi:hypothetical protein
MSLPNTTFNAGQSETITVVPETTNGQPGLIVNSVIPAWSSSPTGIVTITPASDGLSAVVAGVAPGTATVNVQGESSSGAIINSQFTILVQEGAATQFGFQFGTAA